ncbi:MAG: hypothetical protein Q9M19_05880, partial [Mariprofundaceae bacterium]|nr:hypothetical protein [Mariprofundaceae bacterium]
MKVWAWWKALLPYIRSGSGVLQGTVQARRNLAYILLFLSSVMLFIFAVVHFMHQSERLAVLQLSLASFYALCLWLPEQKMPIHIKENVIIMGTSLMFLSLIAGGGIAKTGIYWAPLLPFLVFAVTGIRLGIRWLVLFMLGLVG